MIEKKFECMLGFHEYTIPDKNNSYVKICKHCRKYGYCKYPDGFEIWTEYDDRGNKIHLKNSNGFESWRKYDNNGNEIHYKSSDGYELWKDTNGKWVGEKPKNWRYEYETKTI